MLFTTTSGSPIPLTGNREAAEKKLQEHWGEGLLYRGHDLLDLSMEIKPKTNDDWQETYLGYIVSNDVLVSGFDGFGVVYWMVDDDGSIQIQSEERMVDDDDGFCFYFDGGGYENLRSTCKDLLDLRLD